MRLCYIYSLIVGHAESVITGNTCGSTPRPVTVGYIRIILAVYLVHACRACGFCPERTRLVLSTWFVHDVGAAAYGSSHGDNRHVFIGHKGEIRIRAVARGIPIGSTCLPLVLAGKYHIT